MENEKKSMLRPAKAKLVEVMQRINFGRIEGLVVHKGEPVLDPPPRLVREVKFCAENGPRPEAAKEDFALKAQVGELFAQIEAMGDGVIIEPSILKVGSRVPDNSRYETTWKCTAT